MHEDGRRAGLLQLAGHPPLAFLRNYLAHGGIRDGVPGLHHLGDERVLRVPEVRQAVGASTRATESRRHEERTQKDTKQRMKPSSVKCPNDVLFLHIDTARTWRGGQNQVLLTVNGLRAIGQRAALVAHPDGELRRRAAEGLDLIPIAPRTEMDLSAAWRLSRVIKRLAPDVIHAHDPHGVAMASLALSLGAASAPGAAPALVASRRVDFHLKGNSFSRWKHRQVDCFIAASEAIRQMLVADGVPADRTVTVHEGIDVEHVLAAPPVNVHEAFWLPHGAPVVGNVAALVPHKGQRHLVEAAHLVVQRGSRRAVRDPRRRRAARASRAAGARASPREARAAARLPHRRARLHQGLRPLRDELGDRGPRHLAARRDGLLAADRRDPRRRHSRNRRGRRERPARAAARSRGDGGAIVRLLKDDHCGGGWARPGSRACASGSPSSGWSPRRPPCTHAWPADPTQRTLRVRLRAIEAARVHHAEVAEREVVLDRVVRIEPAQRRGDVARHAPAGARIGRQAQAAADADHVRVERHDELRRRHARPDAEVERVAPHHPAQKQIQPLAGAAGRRARKEVADAGPPRHAAVRAPSGSSASARVEKLSSAGSMSSAPAS